MKRGMGNAGIALLLSLSLSGGSFAGSLSGFEDAVAKPAKHSSTCSDSDDRDCIYAEEIGEVVVVLMASVVYGAYRGVKYVVYDWWAEPDGGEVAAGNAVAEESTPPAYVSEPHEEAVELPEEPQGNGSRESLETVPVEDRFSNATYQFEEGSYTEPEPLASDFDRHQPGAPALPYVRFDYRWQYLDHDQDASDYLLEAGYKYAAFYGRFTQYEDRAANEDLDIGQYYGLFRLGGSDEMVSPGSIQLGLGAGGYVISGTRTQSGPALTIPLMFYPADWCGLEFRPAWASINEKIISDYDVSASLGQRFFHLRAGYRWLWVQGDGHWLNGPYAGVSFSF